MKIIRRTSILLVCLLLTIIVSAQPGDFDFIQKKSITASESERPTHVTKLVLENGLTVYLNEDPNISNVFGAVAVKGGSKRDPEDYTGIAHYFEHIMFKGTQEIGTIDYDSEKVYLDSISSYYDKLGETEDEEERTKILTKLNELSLKAADYAIPNELDKVLERMGGSGVNAFTSKDAIVYYNLFPGNQIEKWLELYSHRFIHPVYRLFQSELETVYEEKNMYMDNPFTSLIELFEANLYQEHPYGQTILGEVKHLKNPSLSRMDAYFQKYYVANNMALILAGNFDAEKAIPIIKEKFSSWRSGDIEPFNSPLKPLSKRVEISKRLTPIKVGILGFQTVPKGHEDEIALEMANSVLSNSSSTGLLDKLTIENHLMAAMAGSMPYVDAGSNMILFIPKLIGQSLSKAEKLVLEQLDSLKAGNFDDELLAAIKTKTLVEHEQGLENGLSRGMYILDAFLEGSEWEEVLDKPLKINQITKEDIVRVANKYYGSNYIALHSKTGFPKKEKLDKPPYKPVEPENAEAVSKKAEEIAAIPVIDEAPKFIELGRDVFHTEIDKLTHFYYVPNPVNNLFQVRFTFGAGEKENKYLPYATELFYYLGTQEKSADEFNREIQKLGGSLSLYSNDNNVTVSISGLDANLEKTLTLAAEKLFSPKGDDTKIKKLIQSAKSNLKMEKKDPSTVGQALRHYVLYGDQSDFLDRLTVKEVKELTSEDLLSALASVWDYEVNIHYSGVLPRKKVTEMVAGFLKKNPSKPELPQHYNERKVYDQSMVFFVNDKKAVQSQIHMIIEGEVNSREERILTGGFNKYFSSDMSSIVFQEVREFRSLAYGASSWTINPFYKDKPAYTRGYLSTQADKTTEAIDVMLDLYTHLPKKEDRLEHVKQSLIREINANRPTFRNISSSVEYWKRKGYEEDPTKYNLSIYEDMSFEDIVAVWEKNILNKPIVIIVVGDKKRIDMDKLRSYGKFTELDKKEIFSE